MLKPRAAISPAETDNMLRMDWQIPLPADATEFSTPSAGTTNTTHEQPPAGQTELPALLAT
jgi:hypothetical protein